MLQITIQCEPHELQSHLDALCAKTSTAPLFDKDAKDAAAAFAIVKQKLTTEDESQEAEAIEAGKKLDAYHTAEITAELIDAKNAAVFKTDDRYTYVVMPLTRDR